MRLLLHIGMPKTGSTSIQRALLANRDRLSELGFWLPESMGYPKSRKFYEAFETVPNQYPDFAGVQEVSHLESAAQTKRDLLREVDEAGGKHHSLIVSAEEMSWRYRPEHVKTLARECGLLFDSVEVVVFLRDQLTAIPSRYWLDLKLTLLSKNFERWVEEDVLPSRQFDYGQLVRRWETNFPRANLRIIPFETGSHFDAVHAFFSEVLGQDVSSFDRALAVRENASGSAVDCEILRITNGILRHEPRFFGLPFFKKPRRLKRDINSTMPIFSRFRGISLGGVLAQRVVTEFYDSNRLLSDQYFAGRFLFPRHLKLLEPICDLH
jgi:hypothetical protein